MTQTAHTPGPWTIERRNRPPSGLREGYLAILPSVAAVQMPEHDTAALANARLIAAAPDLLAALERLASSYETCLGGRTKEAVWREVADMNLRFIRAAIAKATGKGV